MALTPYAGEEHESFLWTAGKPAALLVHGFPGTPAEVRALGEALHGAGWTVQGQQDQVVNPQFTRKLVSRMNAQMTRFVEIDGGHQLIDPTQTGWPTTLEAVMAFCEQFTPE